MPPGDDREFLRLVGIVRQMSCSHTVVQVRPVYDGHRNRAEPSRTELNSLRFHYFGQQSALVHLAAGRAS